MTTARDACAVDDDCTLGFCSTRGACRVRQPRNVPCSDDVTCDQGFACSDGACSAPIPRTARGAVDYRALRRMGLCDGTVDCSARGRARTAHYEDLLKRSKEYVADLQEQLRKARDSSAPDNEALRAQLQDALANIKKLARERRALRQQADVIVADKDSNPWWSYVLMAAVALGLIGLFISSIVYGRR